MLPNEIGDLTLRRVTELDGGFIFQIIKATMAEYVEQTFGAWVDEAQRKIIKEGTHYEPMRIIVRQGVDIGLLTLEEHPEFLWLDQLYLLPDQQGNGLGTSILTHLKQMAADERLPLRLSVLAPNLAARRLYERHGFEVIEVTEHRTRMEYRSS